MSSTVTIREALRAEDLLAVLQLRWAIYAAEYGGRGPACERVSQYDLRARHFGVYQGGELVGAMRFVFRHEQPAADVIRQLDAPFGLPASTSLLSSLPSEEAFDVSERLGDAYPRLVAEVGRFCIRADRRGAGIYGAMAQTVMAIADVAAVPLLLYSCGEDIAPAYTRYTGARTVLTSAHASGIVSERFAFPRRTVAVVCTPREPPPAFARAIGRAAEQLRTERRIEWELPSQSHRTPKGAVGICEVAAPQAV